MLPGAQQLELARRVNLAGRPSAALARAGAGGRPATPVPAGAAAARRPGGPRPRPAAGRPGAGAVGRAARPGRRRASPASWPRSTPPQVPEPSSGVRRPWATRYRLRRRPRARPGAAPPPHRPRPAALVASRAADRGRHRRRARCWSTSGPTGRSARGSPRSSCGGGVRRARDRLPGRLDLARIVARGLAAPGAVDVHLVTDPAQATGAAGLGRPLPPRQPLAATAVDLGRRVVAALRPAAPPETRRALVSEVLRPRLAAVEGPPPVVPARAPGVDRRPGDPARRPARPGRRPLPCLRQPRAAAPGRPSGSRGDPSARHAGDRDRAAARG